MKKYFKFIISTVVMISLLLVWGTNSIIVSRYEISNQKIPESFDGFRIVQISDLHNKEFGKNQRRLIKDVESEKPDIIVVTGDLVDRRKWGMKYAMEFIEQAVDIAPVYYVSGNHEVWSGKYDTVKGELVKRGVHVLDDESLFIDRNGEKIAISGIVDTGYKDREDYVDEILGDVKLDVRGDVFNILLSHRPEHIEDYSDAGFDLVYSGHAHGGQIRIPFIGGIYAPHQGFMPKYTDGVAEIRETKMVISRGLGNSTIPIRVFNRPEITVTELKHS